MSHLQHKISIPLKIVSVVPSQTELLFALGLTEEVVGITKFCIHPNEWFKSKTRVGGTKNLNIEKIKSIKPNIILANKEENTKEQIEILQKQFDVYVSDIETVDDALNMINDIGNLVCKKNEAKCIIAEIETNRVKYLFNKRNVKTLYLIWNDPYMAAGINTFIHSMMHEAGFANCMQQSRYPVLTIDEVKKANPELILLSSEPFPFKQKHIDELMKIVPQANVCLVDGELFSWYGSRMSQSFEYFRALNEKLF